MKTKARDFRHAKRNLAAVAAVLALGVFAQFPDPTSFEYQQAFEAGRAAGQAAAMSITIQPPRSRPRPRYDAMEGIDVAIQNVQAVGGPVTVEAVRDELHHMSAANDIWIPGDVLSSDYGYVELAGSKGKAQHRIKDPQAYREFWAAVARRVVQVAGGDLRAAMEALVGPAPQNYASRKRFVAAYAAYKLRYVDAATREEYAKKIGGLTDYRHDMEREAGALWDNRNPDASGTSDEAHALGAEPFPLDFSTKARFVSAYVTYKVKNMDEATRRQYTRKIGGVNDYKREMTREAAELWRRNHR